jgi:DnaA-homolog protein
MSHSSPQQLSLGVSLNDDATFANFFTLEGSNNAQVVHALNLQVSDRGEQCIFLWGAAGVGLTHLLQASCHTAEKAGLSVQYLPLKDMAGFAPDQLLEELDQLDLVCLDGLEAVLGNPAWEQALFNFFNRMRDSGRRLLMAADQGPHEIQVQLPDLQSRFTWGLIFQVLPMSDDEKKEALQLRARARGLELSDEVCLFILHRAPRDMNELFCYLNRLDDASLAEQRRLTIPFVKQVLGF